MSGLECNKIFASFVVAGLVATVTGHITDVIYGNDEGARISHKLPIVSASNAVGGGGGGSSEEQDISAELDNIGALLAKADINNGESDFKKCATCHNNVKGGEHKVGPNLWGVVGAERARHADYNYSDAIKSKKGIWSFEELAHFINNPKAFIPGTKMTFLGLKKASDIADTLLYLRSLSDAPLALPQPKVAAVAVDAKKAKAPTEHK